MPVDAFAPVDAPTPRFPATCDPHTFVLTSDGSSYTFDGTQRDPVLTLCQGVTYTFDLSAISTDHPLEILSGATSLLVIRQGTTGTYRAPTAAPFPMAYVCMVHGFGATIVTVAP